tara:strand:- start:412 stop:777 length:366 start_codon:yes stop_codon:yes gene_type:complete
MEAIQSLTDEDLAGLTTAPILTTARALADWPSESVLETLRQRLSTQEAAWIERLGREERPATSLAYCLGALRQRVLDRRLAAINDEIARCLEQNEVTASTTLDALMKQKHALATELESLRS